MDKLFEKSLERRQQALDNIETALQDQSKALSDQAARLSQDRLSVQNRERALQQKEIEFAEKTRLFAQKEKSLDDTVKRFDHEKQDFIRSGRRQKVWSIPFLVAIGALLGYLLFSLYDQDHRLSRQLSSTGRSLNELSQQLDGLHKENHALSSRLASAENKLQLAQRQNNRLTEEKEARLKAERNTLDSVRNDAMESDARLRSELRAVSEENERLEKVVEELELRLHVLGTSEQAR